MASVSVTEDYINEMLVDLSDSGNIIFHLHRIPDIQDLLRTRCENAQCLGALVDLDRVTDGSGWCTAVTAVSVHLVDRTVMAESLLKHSSRFRFAPVKTKLCIWERDMRPGSRTLQCP